MLARPSCRMLVFSPLPVTDVKVFIDGQALVSKPENVGGPLYVLPWRPEDLSDGKHSILVSAEVCCVLHSMYSVLYAGVCSVCVCARSRAHVCVCVCVCVCVHVCRMLEDVSHL